MSIRVACLSGRLLIAVISLTTIACQGDLVLPADGSPSSLSAVGGDGQEGTVGAKLPDPLVVRVIDGAANPMSDVSVRFQSDVPGAEIKPSVLVTNASGEAAVEVWLGSTEGIQVVDALLDASAEAGPKASFQLTALAQPPDDRGRGRGGDDDDDEDGHDDWEDEEDDD